MPSGEVRWHANESRISASMIWLPRWLAVRNISVGTPSNWAITATLENTTRAKGREKRAKMMPVNKAMIRMPKNASQHRMMLA